MRGTPGLRPGDGAQLSAGARIASAAFNDRKYIPHLVQLTRIGRIDPTRLVTKVEPMASAIAAYEAVDARQPGWLKVELTPQRAH